MRLRGSLAALALAAIFSVPDMAQALQSWTQVGTLSCKVDPNIGLIIAGHQPMECLFTPNAPEPPQSYDGAINTVGLNVGISAGGVLGWAVFAPTNGVPAGALAGDYVGVSGAIGIGVGAGANVLPRRLRPYLRATANLTPRVDRAQCRAWGSSLTLRWH